jgi:hypothetical protein
MGFENLGFTNTSWISQYDTLSDFLALKFFIQDSWHFPIGLNPNYGEMTNSIVFSGAVPFLSFISKLIGNFLPYNFHYFSIWIFSCFTLHIFFSYKIIFFLTKKINFSFISTLFFLFTPILFQTLEIHLSLGAHWIIIAFIYLEINFNIKNRIFLKTILIVLSSLIHFYFTIMILIMNFVFSISNYFKLKNKRYVIEENLFPLLFLILSMYLVGYFSIPASDSLGFGYGYYKANLLTFFDPSSGFGYQNWSLFLPDIDNAKGEFEGYGYLGLGVIFLFFILLFFIFNNFKNSIKNNYKYIILSIFFLLIALSSSLNFAGINVFEIDLPLFLYAPLSIVRSSGRFIWPIYYLLIIFSIYAFYKLKININYLLLILLIQLIDLTPGINHIYNLNSKKLNHQYNSKFWNKIDENFEKIKTSKIANTSGIFSKVSGLMVEKNFSETNISRLGRYNRVEASNLRAKLYLDFIEKKIDHKTIYVIDNQDHLRHLKFIYNGTNHGFFYRDDIWLLLPNFKKNNDIKDKKNIEKIKYLEVETNKIYEVQSNINSGILGLGWTHPSYGRSISTNGAWSEGYTSTLLFKRKKNTQINSIILNFEKFLNIKNHPLEVDIFINNNYFKSLSFIENNDLSVFLNTDKIIFSSNVNTIEFKIKNPVTPISKLESVDGRLLGLLIKSVEFK